MSVFVIEAAFDAGVGTDYLLVGATTTLAKAKEIGDRRISDPELDCDAVFITEMDDEANLGVWRKDGCETEWAILAFAAPRDGSKEGA